GSAAEHHDAARIRDRQRPQQHAVQRAENRRIGADAKAEAEDREHREAGRSPGLSNGVPQVVGEIVKETYEIGEHRCLRLFRQEATVASSLRSSEASSLSYALPLHAVCLPSDAACSKGGRTARD